MNTLKTARILLIANLALLAALLLAFAFSPSTEALTHIGPDAPAWLKAYVDAFPYTLIPLIAATAWAIHVRSLNAMRVSALLVFALTAILTTAGDTLSADTLHTYSILTATFFALALYNWRGLALNALFVSLFSIAVTLLTAASATSRVQSIVYVRAFLADPPLIALMAFFAAQIRTQMDSAIGREMTLRQEAETALSFKTSLLSMTAHDLRAPLNMIINGAKMLRLGLYKGGQKARADQVDLLERIERSGLLSAHQVEQLLTAAKLEAETGEAVCEEVDHEAIADIAESFRRVVEDKGLVYEVSIRLAEAVFTDPVRVTAILKNLVENAAKFTSQGAVRVSIKDGWSIEVSDTGPGIAPDLRARLFQPFEQVETGDHRGVGLGLYIVKLDTEKLGGTVALSSQIGQGTTVRLTFATPKAAPTQSAAPAAVELAVSASIAP